MHELSIASSIVDTVLKEIEKRSLKSVTTISLRIGVLTDIVPDALQFGFEAMTKDTILEKTELRIESVTAKGICRSCQKDFELVDFTFVCPSCFSSDIEMSQGDELNITYIETDD